MKRICLFFLTFVSFLGAAERPNLVFILADDLGWGELGCYGQEKIKTPHLDQLAAEGAMLMRHYAGAPVCAPSRCVLLTGKNLARAEIRNNGDSGNGRPFPGQTPLSAGAVTLAEVLQEVGYRTGGFGKWGLGPTDTEGSPMKQGFDRFYGYNCQRNAHSFYPPFLDDDEGIVVLNEPAIPGHARKPEGDVLADDYRAQVYAPDRILEEALAFMDQHAEEPFFLYCPFVEPHVAMHPPQEWVDQYPAEWDEEKGVYRGQNGYLPHPRPRAGYAAMISDLDEHVGAVLAKLEELGLREKTLVVFTSDNGTTHGGRDPEFGIGGVDSAFFNSTRGLRGLKGSVYEGGLRVPAIVRWPGKVAAGLQESAPSYFPDWFPTFCAAAGVASPAGLDGQNLLPLLREKEFAREQPLLWEFHGYGGQVAVIDGAWKAVWQGFQRKKPGSWALYHLAEDPAEAVDLSAEHPEKLQELQAFWRGQRLSTERYPGLGE
ncbi:arylsulfatase [Roseibacillus ishigakijimensis]|uniref:Arylsulfatase n=1 Tax=Roseibacillus ishigakijimensis TaxID=454146 RepID=A0A934VG54_9BACT|nr:arylsulfatase [Roseibacillus ishigakijimensis]MBK1832473.1 arylsulfatase [Roseibacillus ishigakijimensis]